MRMEEFFRKYTRKRGVKIAEEFRRRLREKVSVRGIKGTRAVPFAPPRYITGRLYNSITIIRTAHGARVVVFAPYAPHLELNNTRPGFPHAFIKPTLQEMGIIGRYA